MINRLKSHINYFTLRRDLFQKLDPGPWTSLAADPNPRLAPPSQTLKAVPRGRLLRFFANMFPLQLLALVFISAPRQQDDVKDGKGEGEAGGRAEGGTDRKYEQTLRRGDLLVVPRTLFTHFGIYVGGGR